MIIDCISDLHGEYPALEGGDLLIVAGDLTATDSHGNLKDFYDWLRNQQYRKKVVIGGNHDNYFYACHSHVNPSILPFALANTHYLCDSGTEFEGLKIWGSPWTRTFPGMNPHCMAFTCDTEEELLEKWKLIPSDVDILVTHSPPFTILDKTRRGEQVGSTSLMGEHITRLRPHLWVFGHIHESYGQESGFLWNEAIYVNASHVNEDYDPVNKPIRIIL